MPNTDIRSQRSIEQFGLLSDLCSKALGWLKGGTLRPSRQQLATSALPDCTERQSANDLPLAEPSKNQDRGYRHHRCGADLSPIWAI